MRLTCSICLDDLSVSTDTVSALPCGHLYHSKCVTAWINSSSGSNNSVQCPLCKQSVRKNKIITPIYLSDQGPSESTTTSNLADKIIALEKTNSNLNTTLESIKIVAQRSQETIQGLQKQLTALRRERRYDKIIKRVADLRNNMSDPAVDVYLDKLSTLDTPDILVHLRALRARQIQAENNYQKSLNDLFQKDKENAILHERIKILQNHIRKIDSTRTAVQPNQNKFKRKNVVILDSDIEDDDDDEDENDESTNTPEEVLIENEDSSVTASPETEDDLMSYLLPDEPYLVQDHVKNINSERRKRNRDVYEDTFASSSSSPKRRHVINLDD